MTNLLSRRHYVELYGPTTGDRVRLGDTELYAEVEQDLLTPGDELVFGAGKTLRAGTGCHGRITAADGALDLVITNAVIIDPVLGIIKADIGIKDGLIAGIGKAGDPRIMDGVDANLIVGTNTDVRAAEGLIVTAGGLDCHVHFIDPGQCEEALSSGITTLFGGGLGATTVPIASTGTVNLGHMLQASEAFPLNFGFFGKAASDTPEPIIEQLAGGAAGMKIHEDWGATAATIDSALLAAKEADVQIQIHTDTLNEFGFLERTLKAIDGRVIHAYHVEGAGGGHAPDIVRVCGYENILPSSTNPTNPYTVNTFDEHFDMAMVSHHLNPKLPEDNAFAESRIRHETIAAEGVLHDIGAISAIGSDSQGMGRIGETIARTWQNASRMKVQRGPLPEDIGTGNDNARIKRFIAKYTINPARIFGVESYVGSLEVGKMADLVLWKPAMFGIKPETVFKSGFPVMAAMGEANASLYLCEPIKYRRQWGWFGRAAQSLSVRFMSQLAIDRDVAGKLDLRSRCLPVKGAQKVSKRDMLWNRSTPDIRVDPETYEVTVDGEPCTSLPDRAVPLGPLYTLK